jgi:hypothetical protein
MQSCHAATAVDVAFDESNLIADAGLVAGLTVQGPGKVASSLVNGLMLEVLKRVTTPNSRCDTGMFRGCAAHITAQVEHGASAVTAAKPLAECV